MGTTRGRKANLNVTKKSHQKAVISILTSRLTKAQWIEKVGDLIFDDTFLDNPSKTAFVRLIFWISSYENISFDRMMWLKPYIGEARISTWSSQDAYARAIPYAKDFANY